MSGKSIKMAVGLCFVLVGCASSQRFEDYVESVAPVARDKARLFFFQARDESPLSIEVSVDGAVIGGCHSGEFVTVDVSPGTRTIGLDGFAQPGSYKLAVDVKGGEEKYFEIREREASATAGYVGRLAGILLESTLRDKDKSLPYELVLSDKFSMEIEELKLGAM